MLEPEPRIIQITACDGWVCIQTPRYNKERAKTRRSNVLAWALLDSGQVVGLIPGLAGQLIRPDSQTFDVAYFREEEVKGEEG